MFVKIKPTLRVSSYQILAVQRIDRDIKVRMADATEHLIPFATVAEADEWIKNNIDNFKPNSITVMNQIPKYNGGK